MYPRSPGGCATQPVQYLTPDSGPATTRALCFCGSPGKGLFPAHLTQGLAQGGPGSWAKIPRIQGLGCGNRGVGGLLYQDS